MSAGKWKKVFPTICQVLPFDVVWCSGNASDPINEVTVHRARLVLRWVTARRQANHLGM